MKRYGISIGCLALLTACDTNQQVGDSAVNTETREEFVASDVKEALTQLPTAQMLRASRHGTAANVSGDLGRDDVALLRTFRLTPSDLEQTSVEKDEMGMTHTRYRQRVNGLPVVGGDLILHRNAAGNIYYANGSARGVSGLPLNPGLNSQQAENRALTASKDIEQAKASRPQLKYYIDSEDAYHLSWEVMVSGTREGFDAIDLVYVNAISGEVIDVLPQIHTERIREIYNANYVTLPTLLPGTLVRKEGQAAVLDSMVDKNYDLFGTTHSCFEWLFNRDSYDNAGATIKSSVHYGAKNWNAAWHPYARQFIFADGDGSFLYGGLNALDVVAHEFTHAVTSSTAQLIYGKQSGGLNESMSDILGAVCEANSYSLSANTWKIGEEIMTPNTSGDALRYMNDPKKDGISLDHFSDYNDSIDVHYTSGISNLAFYLSSQGGQHPRGRSTVTVTGMGITKARIVWYRALTFYMSSKTDFFGARLATIQSAKDVYPLTTTEVNAVSKAWDAVGVTAPTLLKTWSFETDNDAIGWTSEVACGVSGQTYLTTYANLAPPGGGSRSVRLSTGSFADSCVGTGLMQESPAQPVTAGKTYIVEAYTRNQSYRGYTAIAFYNSAGSYIGNESVLWRTDENNFSADKAVIATAPPTAKTLKIRVTLASPNALAYVDLIRLSVK